MRYRHLNGFISLTRDRDTGRVYADSSTGKPCVDYTPSAFDAAHTLEGVLALAKMCYITGAREIHAFLPGVEPFIRADHPSPVAAGDNCSREEVDGAEKKDGEKKESGQIDLGIADPAFTAWLATVKAAGNRAPYTYFCSAHQMGSCRMSSHAGDGVVDPKGRVWGAQDLYIADASVFPSASGVNPMVTNMAIADWIARGVVADLRGV
jgi:choline dehydrogenase-like flavoprotein